MTFNPQPKKRTLRSEDYKSFIASQPCIICGDDSVCHHEPLKGRGMGCKGPDNESVPLCVEHHGLRHQIGRETFYSAYQLDWVELVLSFQRQYNMVS